MKYSLIAMTMLAGAVGYAQQTPPAPQPVGQGAGGPAGPGRGARVQPDPIDFNDHPGWTQLFDGKTLNGWDGNPEVWRVVDGAIAGEYTTPAGTRNPQTFLIWQGGQPADYELKLEVKLEGPTADSGIQYRASMAPPGQGRAAAPGAAVPAPTPAPAANPQNARWNLGGGYQFDFNFPGDYNGQVVDAGMGARGIVAWRGQVVRAEEGKRPRLLSTLGTLDELGAFVKSGDWNQAHLIARGNTLVHMINGHVMAMLIDEDLTKLKTKGLIGLQCAGNGGVRISFRNIWLRTL